MTGDLISRSALLKELVFDYAYAAADIVKAAPTVDAVSVVRCKDCIWRMHKTCCPLALSELTKKGKKLPLDNDFCSYGERE